jgi:hypothetical protein
MRARRDPSDERPKREAKPSTGSEMERPPGQTPAVSECRPRPAF